MKTRFSLEKSLEGATIGDKRLYPRSTDVKNLRDPREKLLSAAANTTFSVKGSYCSRSCLFSQANLPGIVATRKPPQLEYGSKRIKSSRSGRTYTSGHPMKCLNVALIRFVYSGSPLLAPRVFDRPKIGRFRHKSNKRILMLRDPIP